MTAGRRGADRERQVMNQLRMEGWVVYRAAGSHGCADLVALQAGQAPMLVQVKASRQGPYEHFRVAERKAILDEALKAGATAMLAHWPYGGGLQFIHSDMWPEGRERRRRVERLAEASSGDMEHALRIAQVIEP